MSSATQPQTFEVAMQLFLEFTVELLVIRGLDNRDQTDRIDPKTFNMAERMIEVIIALLSKWGWNETGVNVEGDWDYSLGYLQNLNWYEKEVFGDVISELVKETAKFMHKMTADPITKCKDFEYVAKEIWDLFLVIYKMLNTHAFDPEKCSLAARTAANVLSSTPEVAEDRTPSFANLPPELRQNILQRVLRDGSDDYLKTGCNLALVSMATLADVSQIIPFEHKLVKKAADGKYAESMTKFDNLTAKRQAMYDTLLDYMDGLATKAQHEAAEQVKNVAEKESKAAHDDYKVESLKEKKLYRLERLLRRIAFSRNQADWDKETEELKAMKRMGELELSE